MGFLRSLLGGAADVAGVPYVSGGPQLYVKAPYTVCAIRLPQASGPILGLDVARLKEDAIGAPPPGTPNPLVTGPQPWAGRKLKDLGLDDWHASWRGRADEAAVEEVLRGPVAQVLGTPRPKHFHIQMKFGTLMLSQRGFLEDDGGLDAFAQTASWLAGAIRDICMAHSDPQPFDMELPVAPWAAKIDELPKDTFIGQNGQDLKQAAVVARERGLVNEDPYAFHRAFPDLPVPGEAVASFRGTLPGTSIQGRLVTALERLLVSPREDIDRVLEKMPSGEWGCDSVLFPVREGVPDAHSDAGAKWPPRGRYAIRRGIFVAWRSRTNPHTDGPELDALTADAVAFAREQGLLSPS